MSDFVEHPYRLADTAYLSIGLAADISNRRTDHIADSRLNRRGPLTDAFRFMRPTVYWPGVASGIDGSLKGNFIFLSTKRNETWRDMAGMVTILAVVLCCPINKRKYALCWAGLFALPLRQKTLR